MDFINLLILLTVDGEGHSSTAMIFTIISSYSICRNEMAQVDNLRHGTDTFELVQEEMVFLQ